MNPMNKDKKAIKTLAQNRKAYHDYFVLDKYEAGIELFGTEVKSLRLGQANLKDSYCTTDGRYGSTDCTSVPTKRETFSTKILSDSAVC